MWFLTAPRLKFPGLKEGDIVRVRSVSRNSTTCRNVLQLNQCSNIMLLPQETKIAKTLFENVQNTQPEEVLLLNETEEILLTPVFYT